MRPASLRPPTIAIVGPGDGASAIELRYAESLGTLVAREGWVVINGGVASGVMEAASRGASEARGTIIGVLPSTSNADATTFLSVALVTGMGQARNNIIVLSSDAVAVVGMSPGTAVEASLAIRACRPLVFVAADPRTRAFFEQLAGTDHVYFADGPDGAMTILRSLLDRHR